MSNLLEDFEDITSFCEINERPETLEQANKMIDYLAQTLQGVLLAIRTQEHGKKNL